MKKVLAFLLCVLMAFAFAACAQPAESTPTQAPDSAAPGPAASESAAPQAPAEKVKITYANWGTAEEAATLNEAVKKFNETHPDIEVEVIQIPWENYLATLNTMATAGELPDTAIMKEDAVISWAQQGMLADVSTMYEGSDSKPMDSITFKYEGKPVAYSSANEILLLYYNKDMFDKAGVPYPPTSLDKAWTWDEFVAVAKKLTLDKNGKHPGDPGFDPQNIVQYGAMVETLAWQMETWALSNGGGYYSDDGTKLIINDPASIEGIQKVADLYLKDHVAPLSPGTTDNGVPRSIIAGTVAMTTNGAWNVGTCLGAAKAEGLNYGVGVLPYMKKKVTLSAGGANVVFNTTKHPKEAMEWIKWYYQEENSWPLIESGTWMPILEKYYTDEALTRKWVENPNFPPYDDYKSAVVDVAINKDVARGASWYYVNNTTEFNNLLTSIFGDVWTGKVTAEQAITANLDQLEAIFKGVK